MEYIEGLGERLKNLRKSRSLTQKMLGDILHVSKGVISSYENETRCPPYTMMIRFSRYFHVSVDYLLGVDRNRTINIDGLSEESIALVENMVRTLKMIESRSK